ncbi:MAG: SDR family oxidoreductase [Deltaproteobacteria bacterium]|nr:SDR family oxidoreductase [Deltaproteobacteria bacterium]
MNALITGASSGIGRALARLHVAAGGSVVLVARRGDRLAALCNELGPRAHAIAMDLSAPGAATALFAEVSARGLAVELLVNNAGVGAHGRFDQTSPAALHALLAVNVTVLTELSRAFLPPMIARGSGRVLNLASMAAFVPGPTCAAYHASKAYVLSLSEALAYELRGTGVSVTAACPGAVATEFADAAGMLRTRAFTSAADTDKIAQAIYRATLRGDRIYVPGVFNRFAALMTQILPRRFVTQAAARALENV